MAYAGYSIRLRPSLETAARSMCGNKHIARSQLWTKTEMATSNKKSSAWWWRWAQGVTEQQFFTVLEVLAGGLVDAPFPI